MLGIHWNESEDALSFEIPKLTVKNSKRNILRQIASIYDPLKQFLQSISWVKIVYRENCELKLPWDQDIPTQLVKEENMWLTI